MKPLKLISLTFVTECPHCNAINYYQDNNFEDNSKSDTDGIKCWKCNQISVYQTSIDIMKLTTGENWNPDEEAWNISNGEKEYPAPIVN